MTEHCIYLFNIRAFISPAHSNELLSDAEIKSVGWVLSFYNLIELILRRLSLSYLLLSILPSINTLVLRLLQQYNTGIDSCVMWFSCPLNLFNLQRSWSFIICGSLWEINRKHGYDLFLPCALLFSLFGACGGLQRAGDPRGLLHNTGAQAHCVAWETLFSTRIEQLWQDIYSLPLGNTLS